MKIIKENHLKQIMKIMRKYEIHTKRNDNHKRNSYENNENSKKYENHMKRIENQERKSYEKHENHKNI